MDFKAIPDWVNWLAQDADGTWWGYEVEPLQHFSGWYENEVGQCILLGKGEANRRWQDTLRKKKAPDPSD
jgi:hypothetical protein